MHHVDDPSKLELANNHAEWTLFSVASISWLGSVAAGAVFGAIFGGIGGFGFGAVLAAVVGVPICATVVAISQLLYLKRYSVVTASSAGALTGIASTILIWEAWIFGLSVTLTATLAALFGGAGGMICFWLCVARSPATQKECEPKSVAQFSFYNLILRLSAVAGLIIGWCWILMSLHAARSPVPVAEWQASFEKSQKNFNLVAAMAQEDEGFSISRDGSFDSKALSRERGAEYLSLLKAAGLKGSSVYSQHEKNIRIEIIPKGGFRGLTTTSYVYTSVEPKNVVAAFAEGDVEKLAPGQSTHLSLEDSWYLSIERPDFSDD